MDNNILEVRNLNTYFKVGRKTVKAVNGVSFTARRGKTLGIVGESGCGKSVTAHSIIKLLPKIASVETEGILFRPEEGKEIDLTTLADDGKPMRAIRGKDIAMIFQDPMSCLNPVYTVGDQVVENILEHNPKLPVSEAKNRTIEMFKKLGIPDAELRFDGYPHEFSGGMKQRVMIALGMINNPKLLIADEPTTALDVTIQAQILELMQEIQKEYGTTIIIITHNMGIVADMADDIAVMYMGKVVETGTREQIFRHPTHPYTEALLKSVPVLGTRNKRLEPIRGTTPDPSEMPEGCAFAPRCDYATEQCSKEYPPVTDIGDMHRVACWKCVNCKGGCPNG